MRTISRMAAPLALLFTFAAAASAQPNANDSVDYAPKTQNLAGTFPFDRSYTLDVTSPSQLNRAGTDAIAAGITATLRVNVADFPEGSSDAAAATLVTLDETRQMVSGGTATGFWGLFNRVVLHLSIGQAY